MLNKTILKTTFLCISITAVLACSKVFMATTAPPIHVAPPGIEDTFGMEPLVGTGNVRQIDSNLFKVSSPRLIYYRADQEREDYCWAAAVQMVLKYHGVSIDQEEIVRQIHGDAERPEGNDANLGEIVQALNGFRFNILGRVSYLQATPFQSSSNEMIKDLALQWPLVVGLKPDGQEIGHVYVLMGIEYSYWGRQAVFHEVELYDPLYGRGRVRMSAKQFKDNLKFAIRIRVNHG